MSSEVIKEPFTNEMGQLILPGDKVMGVSQCGHNISTFMGTYVGIVYKDEEMYDCEAKKWVVTHAKPVAVKLEDVSAKKYVSGYQKGPNKTTIPGHYEEYKRISTLWYKRIYKLS